VRFSAFGSRPITIESMDVSGAFVVLDLYRSALRIEQPGREIRDVNIDLTFGRRMLARRVFDAAAAQRAGPELPRDVLLG
jgi:hypothetical protein